jgi:hypothetical protein
MKTTTATKQSELTEQQKSILAQAANILGFYLPVLGEGLRSFTITADDIQGVYLYPESGLYQLKTSYGSNYFNREVFKAAVNIYK